METPSSPTRSNRTSSSTLSVNQESASLSRRRRTFPTDSTWLLEAGTNITSRDAEEEHTLTEPLRDALEQMHSIRCTDELCHPSCDFSLLIAHYYEQLSVQEIADRYGWKGKGSAWYRLERARKRLKEQLILQLGEEPYGED